MLKLPQQLFISKKITLDLTKESVDQMIWQSTPQGFKIKQLDANRYTFLSNLSIGTLTMQGNPGFFEGISLQGELIAVSENSTTVRLYTKWRHELSLVTGIWLVMLVAHLVGGDVPLNDVLSFLPGALLVLGTAYRVQEQALLKRIERLFEKP
ncbi:MAG TPA: hypothetical protein DCE41_38005 [Cytophagales bacterium]|nr:hypothetical protein [Cytophagales bacterium]HAP65145.1 hypothetical protein [Cytophagales bacterium]